MTHVWKIRFNTKRSNRGILGWLSGPKSMLVLTRTASAVEAVKRANAALRKDRKQTRAVEKIKYLGKAV